MLKKNYFSLLCELTKKGIKLRYRNSYLGVVWTLIEPVFSTIILVIVFGTLFNQKKPTFPLYVIIGRLLYGFFSDGTKAISKSIRAHSAMIKKVYVPLILYPLSTALYSFIIFLINLTVLIGVDMYCKVVPTLYVLMIFPALFLLFLLTFGIGLILATLMVFFRDIEYLWKVALMIIMYVSAIFYYPERIFASKYGFIVSYNPLFHIIRMFRAAVLSESFDVWGVLYASIFSFVCVFAGIVIFNRNKAKFVLHL
mgnify:CR=1 FL=1